MQMWRLPTLESAHETYKNERYEIMWCSAHVKNEVLYSMSVLTFASYLLPLLDLNIEICILNCYLFLSTLADNSLSLTNFC